MGAARRINGLFVKTAVLHHRMPGQQWHHRGPNLRERRRAAHGVRADPVQLRVKRRKCHLRVNIDRPRMDGVIMAHAGNTDLTDARAIAAGGFDIQRNKLEITVGHVVNQWGTLRISASFMAINVSQ
jgi:hypothetical protein